MRCPLQQQAVGVTMRITLPALQDGTMGVTTRMTPTALHLEVHRLSSLRERCLETLSHVLSRGLDRVPYPLHSL
jgi:hypothetical protein